MQRIFTLFGLFAVCQLATKYYIENTTKKSIFIQPELKMHNCAGQPLKTVKKTVFKMGLFLCKIQFDQQIFRSAKFFEEIVWRNDYIDTFHE